MPAAEIPVEEATRLAALQRYRVLDTLPEAEYDDLTLLASQICETPVSLVSLVDSRRQWFKSRVGFELEETPREISFCSHAIHESALFEVPDATLDARFCDNSLVTGEHHVRFYAGAPLVAPDGLVLGTLCVIDRKPRQLTPAQRAALSALARQVITLLELRRTVAQIEQSNRELRESREEFRQFMDNSPVVAFIKNRDGRMLYVNKCWKETFGVEAAHTHDGYGWLPDSAAASIRQKDRCVFEENRVVQSIEQVPTPHNPTCQWLVFKFPIGQGAAMRLGGVALDLTEMRRAQKLKDEFIAVVSHELRTPLTALRGSLGLLENQVAGELPPQAREMVGLALKNADRLGLLINDLLDMEKIETGAMKFDMGAIELQKLLQSALELNASYAAPLGVQLRLETLPSQLQNASVWGDYNRLMQVLSNLLSNAAKFTRAPGNVVLRARLVHLSPRDASPRDALEITGEKRVRIEVCDEGQGVPPEFVPSLFERFAQADASPTRRRGGTGLGLAISRAIINKHGTRIGYAPPDEKCKGATFFFELRLAGQSATGEMAV